MKRGMAYRRYVRNKAIQRKKRICYNRMGSDWYKCDGMYAKGKIHCSCRMCTFSKYYDLKRPEDYKQDEIFKSQLKEVDWSA